MDSLTLLGIIVAILVIIVTFQTFQLINIQNRLANAAVIIPLASQQTQQSVGGC